jgi:hypothetical protein
MVIKNEDIDELIIEVPEGHRHLRTILRLKDGREIILQEATVANLVRAYTTVKTHPTIERVVQKSVRLSERKPGFAEWQLVESISEEDR